MQQQTQVRKVKPTMHDYHHHLFLWDVLAAEMHSASLLLDTDDSFVVVVFIAHITCLYLALMFFFLSGGDTLRLCEIQRCGLQRGPAELLLGSVLSELDQHHQRL